MLFITSYFTIVQKQSGTVDCQQLSFKGNTIRYCEKAVYVADQTVVSTQISDIGLSFFLHTETAKNLKLQANIIAPEFSTFSLTGNLIIEQCQMNVGNSETILSVLISQNTLNLQVLDSSFVSYFNSKTILDAATLSLNSTNIIIYRSNITSTMTTVSGSLSGISGNCQSINLKSVSATFSITTTSVDNSTCGAISANMDNSLINISLSNITGSVMAAGKNGLLIGIGNNVSINVSEDSKVTVTGLQPDFSDFKLCNGTCGAPVIYTVQSFTSLTQSSTYAFSSKVDDNSVITFDQIPTLNFSTGFSVFQSISGTIQNLKINGSFNTNTDVNIFGATLINVELKQIIIDAVISSKGRISLISSLVSQINLNSFSVTGTYTATSSFCLINMLGSTYVQGQFSNIINYRYSANVQVAPASLSTLLFLNSKVDLNVFNTSLNISSNFDVANFYSLLVYKFIGYTTSLVFSSVQLHQGYSDTDKTILAGVLFNQLTCYSLKLSNILINYATKSSDKSQTYYQTIIGNANITELIVSNSKITHYINYPRLDKIGLIALSSYTKQSTLTIQNLEYNLNAESQTLNSATTKDFGLVVGLRIGFDLSQLTIINSVIQEIFTISQANQAFIGIITGSIQISTSVTNTIIHDSKLNAPQCTYIGLIGASSGPLSFTNIQIQNCQLQASSQAGLFSNISGQAVIENIMISDYTQQVLNWNQDSAIICGNATNAQITLSSVTFKRSIYSGTASTHSSIVFGSFSGSSATITNCKFNVNVQGTSSAVGSMSGESHVDILNSYVSATNNCFMFSSVGVDTCKESHVIQQGSLDNIRYE
ncbi:Hypothetical_protein [Hexamita inflata]|uniref:Hypothetical_protein n=1 Tax=Hexamita inflata TaxID=28002 RepID=A0AA86NYF5_9EUKA|nr:Hypothetical protein HINF_LOCUS15726 [Hexamita inflata]